MLCPVGGTWVRDTGKGKDSKLSEQAPRSFQIAWLFPTIPWYKGVWILWDIVFPGREWGSGGGLQIFIHLQFCASQPEIPTSEWIYALQFPSLARDETFIYKYFLLAHRYKYALWKLQISNLLPKCGILASSPRMSRRKLLMTKDGKATVPSLFRNISMVWCSAFHI